MYLFLCIYLCRMGVYLIYLYIYYFKHFISALYFKDLKQIHASCAVELLNYIYIYQLMFLLLFIIYIYYYLFIYLFIDIYLFIYLFIHIYFCGGGSCVLVVHVTEYDCRVKLVNSSVSVALHTDYFLSGCANTLERLEIASCDWVPHQGPCNNNCYLYYVFVYYNMNII